MVARKTSSLPTKIYTYGALLPSSGEILRDQIRKAHAYRNRLVELERQRRAGYRDLRISLSKSLGKMQADMEVLLSRKKALHAEEASQEVHEALGQEIAALSDKIKKETKLVEGKYFLPYDQAYLTLKKSVCANLGPRTIAIKTAELEEEILANPDKKWPKPWLKKYLLEREHNKKSKEARAVSGCYPGVYQAVEKAFQQSIKESRFDPPFQKFDGTGCVGSQIDITVADALSCRDDLLKIQLLSDAPVRKRKHGRIAALVSLRLTTKGGAVYLDIPIVMHRPLPQDGVIKWAYLQVKKVGLKYYYELQFTLESSEFLPKPGKRNGVLGINLGWRMLPSGDIRVATTWDGHKAEHLVIPKDMLETYEFSSKLLGYSEDHFNDAKANLIEWLEGKVNLEQTIKAHGDSQDPTELTQQLENIAYWRSHGRLATLAGVLLRSAQVDVEVLWRSWKDERFRGGVDLFCSFEELKKWLFAKNIKSSFNQMAVYLNWWSRKDAHLINWARNVQKRLILRRREIYRVTAARWRGIYEEVHLVKMDGRKAAVLGAQDPGSEIANYIRHFCGVSVLVQSLSENFGTQLIKVNGAATVIHHNCGGKTKVNPKTKIVLTCQECHQEYDQDINAAKFAYDAHKPSKAA